MLANKDAALSFLRMVVAGRVREAYAQHVGPGFVGHNPWFGATAAELMAGMEENQGTNPAKVLEVQRAVAEGDTVMVHSRVRMAPGDRGVAVVHILRFQGGKVVEMWDVAQPVPAEMVNAKGMF